MNIKNLGLVLTGLALGAGGTMTLSLGPGAAYSAQFAVALSDKQLDAYRDVFRHQLPEGAKASGSSCHVTPVTYSDGVVREVAYCTVEYTGVVSAEDLPSGAVIQ